MSRYNVSVAEKNSCNACGEGPHWDELNQCLWYLDFDFFHNCADIIRYEPATGKQDRYHSSRFLSFIVPFENNQVGSTQLVAGATQDILTFNWDSPSETSVLCKVDEGLATQMNDAKCDARGRLWTATLTCKNLFEGIEKGIASSEGIGGMFRIDSDGRAHKMVDGVSLANGFAWSPDNRTLYFIDTYKFAVSAFDYDLETGEATNRRVAVDYKKFLPNIHGAPDGMTVDLNGKLWVANYGGSNIVCWDPETGQPIEEIKFPTCNITSCAFGGRDYKELFVTCSTIGLSPQDREAQPDAGSLFKVTGFSAGGQKVPGFVFKRP